MAGFRPWMSGLLGAVLGVGTVLALPGALLFIPTAEQHVEETSGEVWACPMMDYIGHHPGKCPVCGMTLERVRADAISREQAKRMGVELAEVVKAPAEVVVHAAGAVEYDNRLTKLVIPRIAGRIVRRHPATFGCCQEVAAAEPVVDLYSPEAFQAQGELQAALKLGDKPAITALTARFERWNLASVAAKIVAGGEPVDTVTITSPFAGQVLLEESRMVDETLMVGKEVAADMPLLRLVEPGALTLVVRVPERQAWLLAEGNPVELSSDDRGRLDGIEAVVGRIANEIDPAIRSVEVRIYLRAARNRVKVGSLVTARIRVPLGDVVQVPKDAVLSTGVRDVAWRLAERKPDGSQRFVIAPLDLGIRIEGADGRDRYVVRGGLKPGDQVAAQGSFLIDAQAQLAGSPSLLNPVGVQ